MTPMLRQYFHWKEKYPQCVLFFRMGDFYESFFDDAKIIAEALDITLTARDPEKKIPMAGVPWHAAEQYLARLVEKGYKVAVCEQTTEPDGRNLVDREVVQVVTPGTWLPAEGPQQASVAALCPQKNLWHIAFLRPSSSHIQAGSFQPDEALTILSALAPREILVPQGTDRTSLDVLGNDWIWTELSPEDFNAASGASRLALRWGIKDLSCYGNFVDHGVFGAVAAVLSYVDETSFSQSNHISGISQIRSDSFLHMDVNTQHHLELFGDGATLYGTLNRCRTAPGRRLLHDWIARPLLDHSAIANRQETIARLMEQSDRLPELSEGLAQCRDVERAIARLHMNNGGPRDLAVLRDTLKIYPAIVAQVSQLVALVELPDPAETAALSERLSTSLVEVPPRVIGATPFFAPHVDDELDQWRRLEASGNQWLDDYLERERRISGIFKMKVTYNKIFGYAIEISKNALLDVTVPEHFERRQTLVNAERFVTPELKDYENRRLQAESRIRDIENRLFDELCLDCRKLTGAIQKVGQALSRLDVLLSLTQVALEGNYCRPRFDSSRLSIQAGRHPVVEKALRGRPFIPNNFDMSQLHRTAIITGPNMAGKSTYLRTAAIIQIMAQMGAWVPAEDAELPLMDRLFTRIGARDELARGNSTFMVEMVETANILHNVTSRSLVILDEIGRGTSTYDGMSIAWAVLEYLHEQCGQTPWTYFATHYHELSALEESMTGLFNLSMAVDDSGTEVHFLHKVQPGPADRSYGVEVARIAGLPRVVLRRAGELLEKLEAQRADTTGSSVKPSPQIELFDLEGDRLIDEVAALCPDDFSPRDALEKIYHLVDQARKVRKQR